MQDNLIAVEMKKSTGRSSDKNKDRDRLECLAKSPDQDIWSYGGKALPEHVCGYGLGVYYEVNFRRETILVEYYCEGYCYRQYEMNYVHEKNYSHKCNQKWLQNGNAIENDCIRVKYNTKGTMLPKKRNYCSFFA